MSTPLRPKPTMTPVVRWLGAVWLVLGAAQLVYALFAIAANDPDGGPGNPWINFGIGSLWTLLGIIQLVSYARYRRHLAVEAKRPAEVEK